MNTLSKATIVIPVVITTEVHNVESSNTSIQRYKKPKLIGQLITKLVKTVTEVSFIANFVLSFLIKNWRGWNSVYP